MMCKEQKLLPLTLLEWWKNREQGQSILELILAMAVFALIGAAMTTLVVGSFTGLTQGGEQTQAEAIAQEGIEAVRSISQEVWNENTYSQSGVSISGSEWVFDGESTTDTIGQFTRTLSYVNACRDGSDNIASCPATYTDVHTTQVTSSVSWDTRSGVSNTVQKVGYITNWDSQDWIQTDWSGGSGQSTWSDTTKFDTESNVNIATTGQVQLATAADGTWTLMGGTEVTDTTDTDFNAGTHSSTQVTGTGNTASVILTQSNIWVEVPADVTNRNINDVYAVSASDIWAGADNGEILHYDGTSWSVHTDLGNEDVEGIHMISSSNGWAAADSGKFVQWNGSSWAEHTDIGGQNIFAVKLVSTSDGWAVGASGKIWQWNGSTWTEHTDIGGSALRGLYMVSTSDGWAVGSSGKLVEWNGSTWTEHTDTGGTQWNAVWLTSTSSGWVVGNSGDINQWNGSSWVVELPIEEDVNDVEMVNTSNSWAVGDSGKFWNHNGSRWAESQDLGSVHVNGVTMISATDGWAVGNDGERYFYNGTAWAKDTGESTTHTSDTDFDGGTFSSTEVSGSGATADIILVSSASWAEHADSDFIGQDINDIEIVASNDIWAVADSGKIIHYNGTSWTETIDFGGQNVFGIDAVSASDIWAAGASGKLWHYNGTSWSEHTDTGNETWNDIACTSSSNCWAVGNGGDLAQYNGSTWSESTIPDSADIDTIYALSSSDIWAAGASGRIWHYTGSWSLHTDTGNEQWNALVCVSASDCWALGNGGDRAQYNGSIWTESSMTENRDIDTAYVISASNIWAAGASGHIWNYNGTSWSLHTDTGGEQWNGLAMVSSSSGWVVGNGGEIFEYASGNYASSGTFESEIIDSGVAAAPWDIISWTEVLTTGSDVTLAVRTGETATPDGSWTGWSGEETDPTGSSLSVANGRYIQWRGTLTRGTTPTETPEIEDVTAGYGSEVVTNDLNAVDAVSSSDVWAVGDSGKIIHYNGTSWTETIDFGGQNVFGIDAVSASDIWAAGASGKLWHYNGTSWSEHTDTGNETWNDIACTSSSNCWAVGNGGDLAQYNGSTWSESTIPDSADIDSIHAVSSSDIWVVGASGKIWHYNGTSWSLTIDTGGEQWNGVSCASSTSCWAVGNSGAFAQYGNFYAASGTFTSRVLDSGTAGTDWSLVSWSEVLPGNDDMTIATRTGETSVPDVSWTSFSAELEDELGSSITSASGRYLQYRATLTRGEDGTQTPQLDDITLVYGAPTDEDLHALAAVSSSDIWSVGENGVIVHYNGTTWSLDIDTGDEDWNDVMCTSSSNCWAVGNNGALAQYNGTTWLESTMTENRDVDAIYAVSASDIWAVGESGHIWQYNGSTWSLHTDTGGEQWNDIVCTSTSNCWAVGNGGDTTQWDGASWSAVFQVPSSADMNGVYALDSTDIWAVGENGRIWRYTGSWALHTDTGGEKWRAVSLVNASDGSTVGDGGNIKRWLGATWAAASSPTSEHLNDVAMISVLLGYGVGNNGTIVKFTRDNVYQMSGSLTSSGFDMSNASPVQVVEWDETTPSGTDVTIDVSTAPDSAGSPGTWGSWQNATTAQGTLLPTSLNGNQWARYRINLTGDGTDTPVITEVRVNYR